MDIERAKILRPVAEPRVIDQVYTEDQYERLLDVVRKNGPWKLIIAHHFQSGEELIATTSGMMPEGVEPTLDMFLSPVFRGFLSYNQVCVYPEIQDCFYNPRMLDLVREYWGAPYAEPDGMLFNIQGPCTGGGSPHVDATRFRGITLDNAPVWLMNIMVKTGLFRRWQARKAQVIAWYYKGRIGGGFTYWPDGPHAQPKQIHAPMWGRAAVVENEMMFHTAEACGPASQRMPSGLSFDSLMEPDPECEGAWRITTDGKLIQRIPEEEFRFLVHWGANVYMDLDELKTTVDHTDDITTEQVFNILLEDLEERGVDFETPSDPLTDKRFIALLNEVYGIEQPLYFPPEPDESAAA
ncbi:MAG: hypothetical protein JRF61_10820 [Deltaproteobacteria bacterium]|jgi:hypothetical protein|nr:hypothetical protein [Deltaproteobacteria bacterium]